MNILRNSLLFLMLVFSGCGGTYIGNAGTELVSSAPLAEGESEPAARIVFRATDFTDLEDFMIFPVTTKKCLGDVLRVHYVTGDDFMGSPTAFPTPSIADDLYPTNRPAFIRNVSVDMTNTYFANIVNDSVISDSCSTRTVASAPAASSCADFDRVLPDPTAMPYALPTIAPTATPSPTPVASATPDTPEFYSSNFYRVRDDWCTSQGPTVSPDPEITKAGVGGVNIDIDRTQLGAHEDLLMMVTYHALNENSNAGNWPNINAVSGTPAVNPTTDRTILKVNLIGTEQSLSSLLQVPQPRTSTYSNTSSYPIYVKEIATLEDPLGSLRTEQVYVPLSQNGLVDRIRIERVRGSYHLFQIDLYRLGNRAE